MRKVCGKIRFAKIRMRKITTAYGAIMVKQEGVQCGIQLIRDKVRTSIHKKGTKAFDKRKTSFWQRVCCYQKLVVLKHWRCQKL